MAEQSPSPHLPPTIEYAASADLESVRTGMIVRRLGVGILLAILSLALIECLAVIAVTALQYDSPRVPGAFAIYLLYLVACVTIAVFALRRTWYLAVPISKGDERFLIRCWLALAGLRVLVVCLYTVVALLTADARPSAAAGGTASLAVRTLAFGTETMLPMLVIPLLIRRPALSQWIKPMAVLFLTYVVVHLTLLAVPLIALALSEEAAQLNRVTVRPPGVILTWPLDWLLLAGVAAGVSLFWRNRWVLRVVAIGAIGWLGVRYLPLRAGVPRFDLVLLLSIGYTVYNALLTLIPAWLLGWLGTGGLRSTTTTAIPTAEPVDAG